LKLGKKGEKRKREGKKEEKKKKNEENGRKKERKKWEKWRKGLNIAIFPASNFDFVHNVTRQFTCHFFSFIKKIF
jgi:hypothetical protein